jgi:hypothetical protein
MNEQVLAKYRQAIDRVCIGYSGSHHWEFFKSLLQRPQINSICMLGVYYGRDIAYMASILETLGRKNYEIFGIDKFEDSPGADWPEELHGLTWEKAGFGSAPDIKTTRTNLRKLGLDLKVFLHQDLAEAFLQNTEKTFDFIYIDVAHDYQTTKNTIQLALNKLNPNGLIGGDDFSDEGTWGVASAVKNSFAKFELFHNWIWLAQPSEYQM